MGSTLIPPRYKRYLFHGRTGGIVDERVEPVSHGLLVLGHTASIPCWSDSHIHFHQHSEEFYLLLQGELHIYVASTCFTLHPRELLMVMPGVHHAVIGGQGRIEHFGFRAPSLSDKQIVGEIPQQVPDANESARERSEEWGCQLPLMAAENQNRWLIGWGRVKQRSSHLILAYLNFPTHEQANAGIGTRLRMHYHREAWEYYVALQGRKILQIEDELVAVNAGEILEVPPRVRHNVHSREAPYEGFTIRVPLTDDGDKVETSL